MASFNEIKAVAAAYEAFGQKFDVLMQNLISADSPGVKWGDFKPGAGQEDLHFLGVHLLVFYRVRRVDEQYIGVVCASRQLPGWAKWSEPTQVCSMDNLGNVYLDKPFVGAVTPKEPKDLENLLVRLVSPYIPGAYDPKEGQPKAG